MANQPLRIERQCQACKKIFLARAPDVRRGKGKCCSPSCAGSLGNNISKLDPWVGPSTKATYGKKYRAKYPHKEAAHRAVHKAVADGLLKKQPCEVCGSLNSGAHHDDYANPLDVRWLCNTHHRQWHITNPSHTFLQYVDSSDERNPMKP